VDIVHDILVEVRRKATAFSLEDAARECSMAVLNNARDHEDHQHHERCVEWNELGASRRNTPCCSARAIL
jgi:hypothetical protein